MKVLLINPPWYRFFGGQLLAYPIGLCYLAAVLEKEGIEVSVYNVDYQARSKGVRDLSLQVSTMTQRHQEYLRALNDPDYPIWREVEDVIHKESPDLVGVTVMTPKYGSALNVARIAKENDPTTLVVFGGFHPTILPMETISNEEVDVVIRGEGEYTFLELVKSLDSGGRLNAINGITYKANDKTIHNDDRPLIENLDTLPFPARHRLLYKKTYSPHGFGLVITSRGCPFRCIFCASQKVWGRKVRYRSANNVVEEIKEVSSTYRTRHFSFEDDTFTLNRKRVEKICDLLIREKLDILWRCYTRADLLNDELALKMKKAGCYSIAIGVESGDPTTLKLIKKDVTLDQVIDASKILRRHKIEMGAFFMIGFPWETAKEVNKTVSFMKRLDPNYAIYSITTPYPGTELFDMVQSEGVIPSSVDWSTFYHQSPEMFYSNSVTRDEALSLIKMTEFVFDEHNRKKRRETFRHPLLLLRLMISSGLWGKPHMLLKRLRDMVYRKNQ